MLEKDQAVESGIAAEFETRILALVEALSNVGVDVAAFGPKKLEQFKQLEPIHWDAISRKLKMYIQGLERIAESDKKLELSSLNKQLFWYFIRQLNFKPTSDLFGHLEDDDVVEIYDIYNVQLYCSANFFPLCSYSLEELVSHPWSELFERAPEITEELLKYQKKIVYSSNRETMLLDSLPIHTVTELFGPRRRVTTIESRLLSPLFDENKTVAGVVHVFKAKDAARLPA